jgi:hypothetical protein
VEQTATMTDLVGAELDGGLALVWQVVYRECFFRSERGRSGCGGDGRGLRTGQQRRSPRGHSELCVDDAHRKSDGKGGEGREEHGGKGAGRDGFDQQNPKSKDESEQKTREEKGPAKS